MVWVYVLIGAAVGAIVGGLFGGAVREEERKGAARPLAGAVFGGLVGAALVWMLTPRQPVDTQAMTPAQFQASVVEGDRPVLVDFYADWCAPCRQLEPILRDVAEEYSGRADVVKIDADASEALLRTHDVRYLPTTILYAEGEPVGRWVGVQDINVYRDALTETLERLSTRPTTTTATAPDEPGSDKEGNDDE